MLTRADLRELTALSTPTISEVLRRLTDAGLVTVADHDRGRPGPNAEIYAANPDAAYAVAMSVRNAAPGTPASMTAGLRDLAGTVRARIDSGPDLPDDPIAASVEMLARLRDEAGVDPGRIRYVQIGVAGSYDPGTATIRHVKAPGWDRPGLVDDLARRLGVVVGVDNDVNLAAVAERCRGAGRGTDGFALLWLGEEGVGLAIDIDSTLIRGARGGAGEIGYMPVYAPGSPEFKISLQDLVGGPAVLALARDHGFLGRTPAQAVALAAAVTGGAGEFFPILADRITMGLAAVVAVLDPPLVVLAGPVARHGGDALRRAVIGALGGAAPLESSIAITTVHDDAVLLGALDAALATVRETLIASIRDAVG
jgi:predicted NBD/HSP70 family sugar kinase